MYLNTVESAPHVRVSRTLDRVAHYSRESREHRRDRKWANKQAAKAAAAFDPTPRLVKPAEPQVISLVDFLQTTPLSGAEHVELVPVSIATFDQREAVAQRAGL